MQSSGADPAIAPGGALVDGVLSASIVIPSFNRRGLLLETLRSLADQTLPPERYEVVVGIDGSNDGTLEALSQSQFPFALRWVWQDNRGTGAAVNRAAAMARGDVLIFLGDDQRTSRQLVASHLDAQTRHGDVLVQGYYPNAPECARSGAAMVYDRSIRMLPDIFVAGGPRRWHLWGANFSLRRNTWLRVGGYDESFREYGCEDTDLGIRIAKLGVRSVFEPGALSSHLHFVDYADFRRHSLSEGRALVRLADKHGLQLSAFSGAAAGGRLDGALKLGWRRAPAGMDLLGRTLTVGLRLADRTRVRPVQLNLARVIRRLYKVGGITAQYENSRRERTR